MLLYTPAPPCSSCKAEVIEGKRRMHGSWQLASIAVVHNRAAPTPFCPNQPSSITNQTCLQVLLRLALVARLTRCTLCCHARRDDGRSRHIVPSLGLQRGRGGRRGGSERQGGADHVSPLVPGCTPTACHETYTVQVLEPLHIPSHTCATWMRLTTSLTRLPCKERELRLGSREGTMQQVKYAGRQASTCPAHHSA